DGLVLGDADLVALVPEALGGGRRLVHLLERAGGGPVGGARPADFDLEADLGDGPRGRRVRRGGAGGRRGEQRGGEGDGDEVRTADHGEPPGACLCCVTPITGAGANCDKRNTRRARLSAMGASFPYLPCQNPLA